MNAALPALCLALLVGPAGAASAAAAARGSLAAGLGERPVTKVIQLLQDMKVELEKERADDEAVHESLDCWCKENDREKSKAIELGEAKIVDLKSALGEYAAKIEELREALSTSRSRLREGQKALDTATAVRTKEAASFHDEEKELLGTIQACKQALIIISRHHPSLTELRGVARSLEALKLMQAQLAKDTLGRDKSAMLKAFLQQAQDDRSSGLLRVPGYQSYAPQSGQIFGVLKQMQEDFEADLSSMQEQEHKAREDFAALRAAKQAELAAGERQLSQLKQDDAKFRGKNTEAYEELQDTLQRVEIDKTFLATLQKRCAETDKEYEARRQSRLEEIAAVEDTIAILGSDASFNAFGKTVDSQALLLQTGSRSSPPSAAGAAALARRRAAKILRLSGAPRLAMLAEAVQLDAFTKVKAAIDAMAAELAKQQQDEVEHRDWCTSELQDNKRATEEKSDTKASLEVQIEDMKKSVGALSKEIEARMAAVAEMEVEMKKASEVREGENAELQQTVMDQRITQAILKKAIDRMNQVYSEYVLAQRQAQEPEQPGAPHVQLSGTHTDPGNGPARFAKYEQSGSGDRVVAMLQKVLADSRALEDEALAAELDAQTMYENFMKDSNKSIEQNQRSVANLSSNKAKTEQSLSMAEGDLAGAVRELEDLSNVLGDLGKSCDFLLKNFAARQEARAAEIEALGQAKGILSGMK